MYMKRETLERVGRISVRFFRSLLTVLAAIFFFYRCRLPIDELDIEFVHISISVANAVVSFFALQTLVRALHVYDRRTRTQALTDGKVSESFFTNIGYAVKDFSFWLDAALIALITLPIADLPPYFHFQKTFFYSAPQTDPTARLWSTVITQAFFFLAVLVGHDSIRRTWAHHEEQQRRKAAARGGEIGWRKAAHKKKRTERREIDSIAIDLLVAYLIYAVAPYAIFAPILLAMPLVAIFWYFSGILILFLVGVAAFFALRYLRAIRKRRAFFRELSRVCEEKGIPLSSIKHPYRSLFRDEPGENFSVVYKGQRYDCKLLSSLSRATPFIFSPEGYAIRRRTISVGIRNLPIRYFGGGAKLHSDMEPLFFIDKRIDFDFSEEAKKVVILLPIPHSIFALGPMGNLYLLDTGDCVGDYRVYNASGFLGALKRDFLDRR